MAKRLTTEQKAEQAAQAQQDRIAKQVTAFRERIEKERAKRVYSREAAFAADDSTNYKESAWVLYELVGEHERVEKNLRKSIERVQERLAEAVKRLDVGESPSWYSTMLGDNPADIEQAAAQLKVLGDAVTRLAWATGWYVPQVLPQHEVDRRERMLSLRVVRECTHPACAGVTGAHDLASCGYPQRYEDAQAWRVYVGGIAETACPTEQDALVAAARLVGETIG